MIILSWPSTSLKFQDLVTVNGSRSANEQLCEKALWHPHLHELHLNKAASPTTWAFGSLTFSLSTLVLINSTGQSLWHAVFSLFNAACCGAKHIAAARYHCCVQCVLAVGMGNLVLPHLFRYFFYCLILIYNSSMLVKFSLLAILF